MIAIEEIGGIAGIKFEGLKTWKRRERRGGPLPSVAQKVGNTEGALALLKSPDWRGVPALEIEVSESAVGLFFSPRIRPLGSLNRAISRAMPLGFGWQFLPRPARVRACFRMTYIYRPVQRQRNALEHGSVLPLIVD